jgi:HSP20 family protein
MPRSGAKKPLFPGMYNRHLDEMRKLLHVLDPHALPEDEGGLAVPMDSYETESAIVLELDLPGVDVTAVKIVQRGVMLQIEVEKRAEPPQEGTRYICLERHFGRFRRTVRLPDQVDGSQLSAEYQRGVLRIICPKGRERRILIKEPGCEQV